MFVPAQLSEFHLFQHTWQNVVFCAISTSPQDMDEEPESGDIDSVSF